MSSTKSVAPLVLKLNLPHALISLLVLVHAGACGVVLLLPWAWQANLLGAAVLLGNLFMVLRSLPGVPRPSNIRSLEWASDGSWRIDDFAGQGYPARLQRAAFVHPWLVILPLHLEHERGAHTVVLLADSLGRERFRQLRVRLQVQAAKSAAG